MDAKTAQDLDYGLETAKKELIKIEEHLKAYPCPVCLGKHLLSLEAHLEEVLPMAQDDAQQAIMGLLSQARGMRKQLEEMTIPASHEHEEEHEEIHEQVEESQFKPYLTPVGSRCRNPTTGGFVELIECAPEYRKINISKIIQDWLDLSLSAKPSYEKGSEFGILGINNVAAAVPRVGSKSSVRPRKFTEPMLSVGTIHNHPENVEAGLSGADICWEVGRMRLSPYKHPHYMISVAHGGGTLKGSKVMVAKIPADVSIERAAAYSSMTTGSVHLPPTGKKLEELGINFQQWDIDEPEMIIDNPLWR